MNYDSIVYNSFTCNLQIGPSYLCALLVFSTIVFIKTYVLYYLFFLPVLNQNIYWIKSFQWVIVALHSSQKKSCVWAQDLL
jgi:hypothetical protein